MKIFNCHSTVSICVDGHMWQGMGDMWMSKLGSSKWNPWYLDCRSIRAEQ